MVVGRKREGQTMCSTWRYTKIGPQHAQTSAACVANRGFCLGVGGVWAARRTPPGPESWLGLEEGVSQEEWHPALP